MLQLVIFAIISSILLMASDASAQTTQPYRELKEERIALIAAMLPAEATGCHGKPITDRTYWDDPILKNRLKDVIAPAEGYLSSPLPAWDDDAYLDFSRTGQRPKGQEMMTSRSSRLLPLILAECLENKGRYLKAIDELLNGLVDQPTWTLPAHDGGLKNFKRISYEIDLGSAIVAADMAETLWLLDGQIKKDTRQKVIEAISARVLKPLKRSLVTGEGHWWLGNVKDKTKNNWNAVCLAGSVYAALIVIPDRNERAIYAAAGEHYIQYFLNGIRPSGFCDEGGGYWVYGFGLFAHLRETLVKETSGQIDLFDYPRAREGALFGTHYQLTNQLMPTFADSRNGSKVDEGLQNYCNIAYGLGGDLNKVRMWGPRLCTILAAPTVYNKALKNLNGKLHSDEAYTYFEDVGVLVCRPSEGSSSRLGMAVKAGGNTSHSHNDIGSFVISLGNELPLGDPGGPTMYDNKTFTSERFNRNLLNSYGHPVPVIGGKLQRDATRVRPRVLSTSFTNERDEITIDLTPAYDLAELKSIQRTVQYIRKGVGQVRVTDRFIFTQPIEIETALTSRGAIEILTQNQFRFNAGKENLIVEINKVKTSKPKLEEFTELGVTFKRLGITVAEKQTEAEIEIVISPE